MADTLIEWGLRLTISVTLPVVAIYCIWLAARK